MTKGARARFTLRLPKDLLNEYKKIAANKGVSLNALFLKIFEDWVEKKERRDKK